VVGVCWWASSSCGCSSIVLNGGVVGATGCGGPALHSEYKYWSIYKNNLIKVTIKGTTKVMPLIHTSWFTWTISTVIYFSLWNNFYAKIVWKFLTTNYLLQYFNRTVICEDIKNNIAQQFEFNAWNQDVLDYINDASPIPNIPVHWRKMFCSLSSHQWRGIAHHWNRFLYQPTINIITLASYQEYYIHLFNVWCLMVLIVTWQTNAPNLV